MDWDDLRYFHAVAEVGSLSAAARALAVNHSTVYRRIAAFEEREGVALFDRIDGRYVLTAAGEEMRASSGRIAEEVDTLSRRLSGRDLRLTGTLRVTTTDSLAAEFLGPHIAGFVQTYPGIELELVVDTQHLSLSRRQADVAIRPTSVPPETLIGRRVAELAFAVYGSVDYFEKAGLGGDLRDHAWVGFDDSLAHLPAAKWMRTELAGANILLRGNNLFALSGTVAAGAGLAPLPCFMCDGNPKLRRFDGIDLALGAGLWLLTHEDLRHTARVRAFLDFMYESLERDRDLLEGRRPFGF